MEERKVLDLRRRTLHFEDISLYECGTSRGGGECTSAAAPAYRLYFVASGRGTLEYDGGLRAMGRGDGLLICPGQRLRFLADETDPWSYFWVGFRGAKAEDCLRMAGLDADAPSFRCAGVGGLRELVEEMLAHEAPGPENELLLQALLFRFFAGLAHDRISCEEKGGRENAYVQKAIEYIKSDYMTGITVSDIAHHVSLNRSYLFTLFQRVLEVSPQDYLTWYRMSRAKERLVQTDDTIAKIALSCGYADPQVFSRSFKQQTGMTPVNYRRMERQSALQQSEATGEAEE